MFGFKKTKSKFSVETPLDGRVIPITEVKDDVFSQRMVGDGFAVEPDQKAHQVLAPISGKIISLPDSKHAIGIKSSENSKVEVLVHIGLDTVRLAGKGFSSQVKLGQEIEIGQPIISFDTSIMREENLDMTTMVIFTSGLGTEIQLGGKAHQNFPAGTKILEGA